MRLNIAQASLALYSAFTIFVDNHLKKEFKNMNLQHCTPVLFVKDAKKSRDFYQDILGMTEIMNSGDMNFVFKEGLAIWQIMDVNIIPQKLGKDKIVDTSATSRFEICFDTGDLDTVYNKVKEEGVKFLHEINTELWGQRTIRFYDLDGHLIEVGESMETFLRRIYEEEGKDLEATSKRTYTPVEALKHFLNL